MTEKQLLRNLKQFSSLPLPEFFKAVKGKKIGQGCYRKVYEVKFAPEYVIKIESNQMKGGYCNIMEFRNWCNNASWHPFNDWLMPVVTMGTFGDYLIQPRAITYHENPKLFKTFPKEIPVFLTDVKRENWGYYNKRFVCFDYPCLLSGDLKFKKTRFHRK